MALGSIENVALGLLLVPATYMLVCYAYVAAWHKRAWLFRTLIHENGRLTLSGSLLYFDHFIACVPMITMFSLATAGGAALGRHGTGLPRGAADASRFAGLLLGACFVFVAIAFVLSVRTAGWKRTIDYGLQRIERDGVQSMGGNWNQLQLSNVPIALGAIGAGMGLDFVGTGGGLVATSAISVPGLVLASLAIVGSLVLTGATWPGLAAFRNPRWLAHSMREIATYPLTGIPVAFAGVLLVDRHLSGTATVGFSFAPLALGLLGIAGVATFVELALMRGASVRSMAQHPAFAPNGLSIAYLLCAHVFEHFLDFVLIGPLTGGLYALARAIAA